MRSLYSGIFIVIFAFVLATFILGGFSEISYAAEDNVTVDVNVSILSEITVNPVSINWTQITPGQPGGYKNLTIQNTGSVNVTSVYSYITTLYNETTRPYSSSNPNLYSAGGVLVFHNQSDTRFYWAGRIEWNWTEDILNIVWPATFDLGSRTSRGFFRNASNSFVWAVRNGTGGYCNNTGTQLALEDDIDVGEPYTRSPIITSITRDGGDANFSYFSVSRAGNFLYGMCVAINRDCEKIYAYKYDRRTSDMFYNNPFVVCTNSQNIITNMVPGQTERITADVWIPKGLPAGDLRQAVWVFRAS